MKEPWEKELEKHDGLKIVPARWKTYTITQDQMDRLHGAAHSGAMLGGDAAYKGCLTVGAILAEIAFKAGFDKSPGSAPERGTCPCVKPGELCPDCQVYGGVNR